MGVSLSIPHSRRTSIAPDIAQRLTRYATGLRGRGWREGWGLCEGPVLRSAGYENGFDPRRARRIGRHDWREG